MHACIHIPLCIHVCIYMYIYMVPPQRPIFQTHFPGQVREKHGGCPDALRILCTYIHGMAELQISGFLGGQSLQISRFFGLKIQISRFFRFKVPDFQIFWV